MTEFLGIAAGICTTIAFLPQVIQTWKTRSTKDISLGMFLVLCTGIFLWIIYGFLKSDRPVIYANIVTLVLTLIILFFKIRYK